MENVICKFKHKLELSLINIKEEKVCSAFHFNRELFNLNLELIRYPSSILRKAQWERLGHTGDILSRWLL